MIGSKFGMLTVVSEVDRDKNSLRRYACKCDCGGSSIVLAGNLKKGNSTSCGCKRRDSSSKRMKTLNARHLMTDTKVWRSWAAMLERTTSKTCQHYPRYGGAGIGVFVEWLVFENFYAYIGDPPSNEHTIDRIDGSNGYFPGNVRWASKKEQALNRRTTVWVCVNGEVMHLAGAAVALGVGKSTASRWLKSGKIKRHEQQAE